VAAVVARAVDGSLGTGHLGGGTAGAALVVVAASAAGGVLYALVARLLGVAELRTLASAFRLG
ncbi:hypothetical protein AB0J52_33460, partial [Spirillospora sp. NPDC049652]